MNEKGEDMMTEQEREKLADEIIKLFKEKNLTIRGIFRDGGKYGAAER